MNIFRCDLFSFFPVGFVLDCQPDADGHQKLLIMGANPSAKSEFVRFGFDPRPIEFAPEVVGFIRRCSGSLGQNGLYERRVVCPNGVACGDWKEGFVCAPGNVSGANDVPCDISLSMHSVLPFVIDPAMEEEDRQRGDVEDIEDLQRVQLEVATWYPIELESLPGRALGAFRLDDNVTHKVCRGRLAFVYGSEWDPGLSSANMHRFGRKIGSVKWAPQREE